MAGRLERLHPRLFAERHPDSAWWNWLVNGVAASSAWSPQVRARILRRGGIEVGTALVQSGVYFFSTNIEVGDWVWINHRVYLDTRGKITIGDRTGLGPETMVITSTHEHGDHYQRRAAYKTEPVTIGAGCWIGSRVMIMPGVTIEDGCTIASGAVVTRDCPADGLYAGVPARRVKDLP